MRLWLVRHARPLVEPGLCYGALEVEADPAQTAAVARELAGALPRSLELLASPRRRCVHLAQALSALRPDLAWRVDQRLAEMDFGRWEGRRWDDLDRCELDAWSGDFANYRTGGCGESSALFLGRVGQLLDEAILAGRDQAWITHGGVYKALLLRQNGVGTAAASDWPGASLAWGQVCRFEFGAG